LSGIFGAVSLDGSPLSAGILDILRVETAVWGCNGGGVLCDSLAGLGFAPSLNTPEAVFDRLPSTDSNGFIFTAAGRVDNRGELADALGLGAAEASRLGDGEFMRRAWLRWGDSGPERIFGDWAFAVWNPAQRRLFLARDHSGNTVVYHRANPRFFAFSSSRQALLKLNLPPIEMDELYLAQVLVSWAGNYRERTIHKQIKRLPPSHHVAVTPERIEVRQYWQLENAPELLLPRNDYVPAFLEIFDRAVRDRLRGDGPTGIMLSGGLDSSAIAVTGARYLREEGRRLSAFTSVPCFETAAYTGPDFGDELPFARSTTDAAGNIDLTTVGAEGVCPIDAIRRTLRISLEPRHSAGNMFWLLELRRMAAERGCRTLLCGQFGNVSISWAGDFFSQPVLARLRGLGWKRWLQGSIRRQGPQKVWRSLRRYRLKQHRWHGTAIRPDFADRLDLTSRYLDGSGELTQSPLRRRFYSMNPTISFVGALQAEMGNASGLEMRDPTADARVLSFCLSVPDRIFINPETGLDRWLIREAMKGRLPESVRLNRRRGRQAADLVPRLRNSAAAVEGALGEIEGGPAAEYVNVSAMRAAWDEVRTEDTPEAFGLAVGVLTRGIMAGLFVNGFGKSW
jgi:asparagine synthase (glutamine-hydrolysing)